MRSVLLSAFICSLISLSLTGCGGDSDPTPAPAPAPAECADVAWRLVPPSDAGNTSVNSTNRDVPHFVTSQPTTHADDLLRVFLPGTYGQPGGSTYLLESIGECNRPTIGLSYNYIPYANSVQNEICYNASRTDAALDISMCLVLQHQDGLFGTHSPGLGDGWAGLWPLVSEQDSVVGRLASLLKHLHGQFPDQGWDRFFDSRSPPLDSPRWERIMVSGHSQGAGHAAYLAQTVPLAAAALLSGPQDECIGCADGNAGLWFTRPWATHHVTAAAHVSESATDTIQANWATMADSLGWPAQPTNVGSTALTPPPYGDVLSEVPYDPQYTGGRPYHVSMAGDGCTPMTTHDGEQVAVYGLALWPALFADPHAAGSVAV